jgi:beta-galactosidase/beta-glucuronidase
MYETAFEFPGAPQDQRVLLDLGEVGLAAEVWINGEKAGERAWRPFVFDITHCVRRGANQLRVRVANSNAGAMAQGDPVYERGGWGVKFTSERDRLRTLHPNGLEGPVRILTETR